MHNLHPKRGIWWLIRRVDKLKFSSMRWVALWWVYPKRMMMSWVGGLLISLSFPSILTQAWNQWFPSSLFMFCSIAYEYRCILSICYVCPRWRYVMHVWRILITWKWIFFYKFHVSHVLMHPYMVNSNLTSWDGLINMLDLTFGVRYFGPTLICLGFFKWEKIISL